LSHANRPMIALAAGVLFALATAAAKADGPSVVASIKPLHSIVAAVMRGVEAPRLLVGGGASPHAHALRPSQVRALGDADVVFWVGETMEGFLAKTLRTLPERTRVVELTALDGVDFLHRGGDRAIDPHFWLDPSVVRAVVPAIVGALTAVDGGNGEVYRANGRTLSARLDALDAELRERLKPIAERPFLVFHDAYGYLPRRYPLNIVGAITVSPDRPAGARHLSRIRTLGAACVFTEPPFQPKVAEMIVAGTGARLAALDPLGTALEPGPELYFDLMRDLATSIVDCLTPRT
jgi:zinc transport system substrate-binding protein